MLTATSFPLRAAAQSCRAQKSAMAAPKAAFSTITPKAPSLSLSGRTTTTCLRLRSPTMTTCTAQRDLLPRNRLALIRSNSGPHSSRKFTTTSPSSPSPFFTTSIRSASTTAASANPAPSPSSSSVPVPASPSSNTSISLPWNAFFRLRKRRRYITLSSSVIGSGVFFFGGVAVLSTFDLAEIPGAATLGLDPFLLLGLETFGFAVVGWLLGPVVGEALFRVLVLGKGAGEFQSKEREFFARIKKHRVDPANSSVQNPVPDYYGEKIGGVQDYRRWLKDQRAFNLKRQKNLI